MRTFMLCIGTLLLLISTPVLAAPQEPTNDDQKTLYALGLAISQSLGAFSLSEAELDMVKNGITDGVLKRPQKVDLDTFRPKLQQLAQARAAAVAESEKKSGVVY